MKIILKFERAQELVPSTYGPYSHKAEFDLNSPFEQKFIWIANEEKFKRLGTFLGFEKWAFLYGLEALHMRFLKFWAFDCSFFL